MIQNSFLLFVLILSVPLSAAPSREAFALEERAVSGIPIEAFELGVVVSITPVRKADIFGTLIAFDVIDSSGNILDAEKLAPGQPARQEIDRLFSRGLQGSQHGELLYQDLRSRQHPDALHLTSSASPTGETGSGFQVLDADMVHFLSFCRKEALMISGVIMAMMFPMK